MRLFAGIPVSGPAETELVEVLSRVRSSAWPVKWVRPEGLHLTVKFLGEVHEERLPALVAALARAGAGTGTLHFNATGLGGFPNLSAPRILWAGFEAEAALELLMHRVERACAELRFPLDGHPHRPHVTLGRLREGARLPDEAGVRLSGERLAGNFVADEFVLYQSRTGAGGSRYEKLSTFPMEP